MKPIKLAFVPVLGKKIIPFFAFKLLPLVMLTGCQSEFAAYRDKSLERKPELMKSTIYVQTARGSFNHQAVSRLYQYEQRSSGDYRFSGTPLQTFENAAHNNAPAFVALRNDLIPGHLVNATVEAMKLYRVTCVTAGVSMPIEMCLLRTRSSVEKGIPLAYIASHPAALLQVGEWKSGKQLNEIDEPDGTSAAASRLASGEYSERTGAIGSCALAKLYHNLIVAESGIQDRKNNKTLFGRLKVEKRENAITEAQAREELKQVIAQAKELDKWSDE